MWLLRLLRLGTTSRAISGRLLHCRLTHVHHGVPTAAGMARLSTCHAGYLRRFTVVDSHLVPSGSRAVLFHVKRRAAWRPGSGTRVQRPANGGGAPVGKGWARRSLMHLRSVRMRTCGGHACPRTRMRERAARLRRRRARHAPGTRPGRSRESAALPSLAYSSPPTACLEAHAAGHGASDGQARMRPVPARGAGLSPMRANEPPGSPHYRWEMTQPVVLCPSGHAGQPHDTDGQCAPAP